MSVMINDMILGWTESLISGIGKIRLTIKNWAYFALSFEQSFLSLCPDQETSISGIFCADCIELAGSDDAGDNVDGNEGHSGFFGGAQAIKKFG